MSITKTGYVDFGGSEGSRLKFSEGLDSCNTWRFISVDSIKKFQRLNLSKCSDRDGEHTPYALTIEDDQNS